MLKTIEVVRKLEVPYWRIIELIRNLKLPPPTKDVSGEYLWSAEDVARARAALANPPRRGRPPRKAVARA